MKILFLCRSLGVGGAERQLVLITKGLSQLGHSVSVSVFYPGGTLEKDIRESNIPAISLQKRGRWDVIGFLFRLIKALKNEQPQIIYSYLGIPNILTAFLKPLFTEMGIVWGIRASYMDLSHYDWLASLSYRLERMLSRFADLIIVNSKAGFDYAVLKGFPEDKMVVIPNGIDTDRFCPDLQARETIRSEWGIANKENLIGLVARLDPMKDHHNFLNAASLLKKKRKDVKFVCVGYGEKHTLQDLQNLSNKLGLTDHLIWTGLREDMTAVYNALDILCSSSYGEGFSNVIGEAMACGIPCVVTDVGDSAWIVGNAGIVVPPKSPEKLSDGLNAMLGRLGNKGSDMKIKARERIVSEFNLNNFIQKTSETLEKLL